jgi:putative transcriptional regulator
LTSTDKRYGHRFLAPAHHPAPELLIDYASGANSPAEMLLVDLHLAFCAGCRRSVRVLFAAGGEMLDRLPGEPLAPDLFDKTLQLLDRTTIDPAPLPWRGSPQLAVPPFAAAWPRAIRRHVAQYNLERWRWMPAGFRSLRIPFPDRSRHVWVIKAPGGRGPFPHSHTRDEWTVVLEGGFTDETGTYNAGDFAHAAPGEAAHTVVAEPGEGCVCVLLTRAAPVYTTWAGKLVHRLIGV